MFKPFKPPLLKRIQSKSAPIDLTESSDHGSESESDEEPTHRPAKRRRLLVHVVEDSPPRPKIQTSSAVSAPRKPLIVKSTNEPKPAQPDSQSPEGYYMVLWRKFTAKKHKTWDGDGVLAVYGGYARLQDISGRDMGKCMFNDALLPGSTLSVGGKDVEIDSSIPKADFLSGKPFLKTSSKRTASPGSGSSPVVPKKVVPLPQGKTLLLGAKKRTDAGEISAENFYSAPKKSVAMGAQFKNPMLTTTIMPQNSSGAPQPRHDPDAENAVVMKRPMDCPRGKQIVDVVIDPFLGKHLRKHQQEGVKFLYECVMGLRDFNGQGAVLADEMGLGKTLQTIALIWTLLKQNPIYGSEGVIKKALIVCPVTLIDNWKNEFRKWLGNERIGVFVAESKKDKLTDFTHGKSYSVMIIGYEKLRSVQEELKKGGGIDIVIADEGHRLKTAQNKSALAIKNLNTQRRIILSGTPIQNDLSEFYTMVDFVNPGLLATYNTFKKEFEGPILRSRQPEASKGDIEKGTAREAELSSLTKMFILRRTAEIMAEFLKPKTEYVVFCKPTQAQVQVYNHVLQSPFCGKVLGGGSESSLQLITLLKKVCNAPSLLQQIDGSTSINPNVAELLKVIPKELLKLAPVRASTKFRVLDSLLKHLSSTTKEKVVIVSNYTQTLDIIGKHLSALNLTFLRLDGSTPTAKRQDLVNAFNKTSASNNFAFLLSAKSGGSGLNLIGASRLILFDPDWNPSTDLQAMARIHRDGQKLPVKIYRFLMAGGMDEKVYQRQLTKRSLADSVVDGKKSESSFSAAELRDLFRLDLAATCQTHDLLGCDCKGSGMEPPSLAVGVEEVDATLDEDVGNESDDSLDLPVNPLHLVPGTKANINAIQQKILAEMEEKRLKKTKGKMQALMRYKHIDTSVLNGELVDAFNYETEEVVDVKKSLDDDVLALALSDMNCKVNFVFSKKG